MSDASLKHVFSLSREVSTLAATGLPLDIGLRPGESLDEKLESINASLASQIAQGKTIEQAISSATGVPDRYRAGLWAWTHDSDPTIALERFAVPAEAIDRFGKDLGRIFQYPLLLLGLAYCALLVLCFLTLPTLESLFESMFRTDEPIHWLILVREWVGVWALLFPLGLLMLAIGWRIYRGRSNFRWVPGSERYFQAADHANIANQLAALIESGRSTDEALSLLASVPIHDAASRASAIESLPPLLQWAISTQLGSRSPTGVLRMVAESYRQAAQRQQDLWHVFMPSVAGVVLGGIIVLAYGLTLFLPLVKLLFSAAS
jgi:type II secretory pathway component PulF